MVEVVRQLNKSIVRATFSQPVTECISPTLFPSGSILADHVPKRPRWGCSSSMAVCLASRSGEQTSSASRNATNSCLLACMPMFRPMAGPLRGSGVTRICTRSLGNISAAARFCAHSPSNTRTTSQSSWLCVMTDRSVSARKPALGAHGTTTETGEVTTAS
jgi:hypothetical protein